jgi:hypothetical protein
MPPERPEQIDARYLKVADRDPTTQPAADQLTRHAATSVSSDEIDRRSSRISEFFTPPERIADVYDIGVALQDWEGYVEHVGNNSFTARLLDRTKKFETDTEIAEIPIELVNKGDLELLFEGGIFLLFVRRRITSKGNTEHSVSLHFRRPPAWTAEALAKIRERRGKKLSASNRDPVDSASI